MKTFSAKAEQVERKWYVLDADNQVVRSRGRKGRRAAPRGKHKAIYTSHVDTGDFVIVINAEKAHFYRQKRKRRRST